MVFKQRIYDRMPEREDSPIQNSASPIEGARRRHPLFRSNSAEFAYTSLTDLERRAIVLSIEAR